MLGLLLDADWPVQAGEEDTLCRAGRQRQQRDHVTEVMKYSGSVDATGHSSCSCIGGVAVLTKLRGPRPLASCLATRRLTRGGHVASGFTNACRLLMISISYITDTSSQDLYLVCVFIHDCRWRG